MIDIKKTLEEMIAAAIERQSGLTSRALACVSAPYGRDCITVLEFNAGRQMGQSTACCKIMAEFTNNNKTVLYICRREIMVTELASRVYPLIIGGQTCTPSKLINDSALDRCTDGFWAQVELIIIDACYFARVQHILKHIREQLRNNPCSMPPPIVLLIATEYGYAQ